MTLTEYLPLKEQSIKAYISYIRNNNYFLILIFVLPALLFISDGAKHEEFIVIHAAEIYIYKTHGSDNVHMYHQTK